MPDKNEAEIVYYRAKADASGALAVGCILLAFALLVLTQDSILGIGFSKDLIMMSTYLALPLGLVLVLANIRHILAKGPTRKELERVKVQTISGFVQGLEKVGGFGGFFVPTVADPHQQ